jgi:hypothetical protein
MNSAITSLNVMSQDLSKLDLFGGNNYKRWKEKMEFLLTTLTVRYVLNTPTTKKYAFSHFHLATCKWPRVRGVVNPVVAKCTTCHVYTKYTLPLCHVSNKTRGL